MGARLLALGICAALLPAAERSYEVEGQIVPEGRASVSLHGATTPFMTSTLADARGRFRFKKIAAGAYTLSVFVPARGEARRTIQVGPSLADAKGKVRVTLEVRDSEVHAGAIERRHRVSARELSIPASALRHYEEARRKLARQEVEAAVKLLERAVELAPQFVVAWNHLGTIAYQTRQYVRAEHCFRQALKQDPSAFEPLVNLGGVLLNLGRPEEALSFNLYAVLRRPNDALANSQLGMTYHMVGNAELAIKYLTIAKKLDPAHFSHPQMLLAEIRLRRQEPQAAAEELEDFLRHHPDWPQAAAMREAIRKLRQ